MNDGAIGITAISESLIMSSYLLSCQESNPNEQSQNLMCYHYTTGQLPLNIGRKSNQIFDM